MKISYNWLKDYLELSIDPHDLAERLSLLGLEVEEVIEKRLDFPNVVIGKVLKSEGHPNADKLSLCKVDVGDETLSIVCGATNVAAGQTVAVAKVGALLPNGFKIRKSKIRGETSQGMICSEKELGLAEESDGIWVLPDGLPLGESLNKALNFENDFILDLAITPNRPDCMSHLGVAREIGAILNQTVQKPKAPLNEIDKSAADEIQIRIDSPESCPRYSARVIREITVGESPSWLVKRLEAVGVRSINNVVDATNYVLMETGHPLHAFDLDLLEGQQIIVRESEEGENFVTLDDKPRILKTGTVLICDGEKPVAIGGIMGGLNSEVNRNTKNILLESAYFNPESIQRSSRYLGLATEASQRFERGADPNGNLYALDRVTQIIAEICGGKVLRGAVDVYPKTIGSKKIPFKVDHINKLLGTNLSQEQITKLLSDIDLSVEDDKVIVPTFRPDLERVADLAEEVARLFGLDNIAAKKQFTINYDYKPNDLDDFIDQLKNMLTGMGLQEVITGSMVNKELWEKLTNQTIYPILNPISKDLDGMRNSLLPSLAQVIQYNRNRQMKDLKIFEINRIFIPGKNLTGQPQEYLKLAIAITGKRDGDLWYSSHQDHDFYDIKGVIQTLLTKISLDNWQFIYYRDVGNKGEKLGLQTGKEEIGFISKLSNQVADFFEIEDDVFVAELTVDALFNHKLKEKRYQPIARYPWVDRDLALVVDEDVEVGNLEKVLNDIGGDILTRIDIFDIYRGKQIPHGKKSVALRLIFQSSQKTLTEAEISQLIDKMLNRVAKEFDAKIRE